jgi:hypothetical protein
VLNIVGLPAIATRQRRNCYVKAIATGVMP